MPQALNCNCKSNFVFPIFLLLFFGSLFFVTSLSMRIYMGFPEIHIKACFDSSILRPKKESSHDMACRIFQRKKSYGFLHSSFKIRFYVVSYPT